MKSNYEFSDYENEMYARSQEQDNNEPPDKVTKWLVIGIILLFVIEIIVHLKK